MGAQSREIVVVDDDVGVLESFDAMFGDDYPLVTIDNGQTAVEYIREHQPKLVFLDIKMPGLNGLEVLRLLQSLGLDTEVVMVTATTQAEYEEEAKALGVTNYIRKPFDVDEVENITKRVLH